MKQQIKIMQSNFVIDGQNYENFMVLGFTLNGQVFLTQIVKYPDWFKFFNSDYPYYSPCLN